MCSIDARVDDARECIDGDIDRGYLCHRSIGGAILSKYLAPRRGIATLDDGGARARGTREARILMMTTTMGACATARCAMKAPAAMAKGRQGVMVKARIGATTTSTESVETTTTRGAMKMTMMDKVSVNAMTALMTISAAGTAQAADVKEVEDFLIAFWKFRTADVSSFLLLTVAPILVPYLVFAYFIKEKTAVQLEKLEQGGWIAFMAERELDATTLKLPQLNAFVKAADLGVLDDAMVKEFVRQLKLSEQWKKSTIAIDDTRAEEAKKRARAEAILEAKLAREKEMSNQ